MRLAGSGVRGIYRSEQAWEVALQILIRLIAVADSAVREERRRFNPRGAAKDDGS